MYMRFRFTVEKSVQDDSEAKQLYVGQELSTLTAANMRGSIPLILMMALILFVLIYSSSKLQDNEEALAEQDFCDWAHYHGFTIEVRISRVLQDVNRVASLMAVMTDWRSNNGRLRFSLFCQDILNQSIEIQSLAWAPAITNNSDRTLLETQANDQLNLSAAPLQARSDGLRGFFRIDALGRAVLAPPLVGATPSREAAPSAAALVEHAQFPIIFVEPLSPPNLAQVLYDNADAPRNGTVAQALLSGAAAASPLPAPAAAAVAPPLFIAQPCAWDQNRGIRGSSPGHRERATAPGDPVIDPISDRRALLAAHAV